MSSNSVARTYRISTGIHARVVNEAERLKASEADVVRLALRKYFEDMQARDQINALEQRLISRIDAHGERLGQLIGQILSLAQPQ